MLPFETVLKIALATSTSVILSWVWYSSLIINLSQRDREKGSKGYKKKYTVTSFVLSVLIFGSFAVALLKISNFSGVGFYTVAFFVAVLLFLPLLLLLELSKEEVVSYRNISLTALFLLVDLLIMATIFTVL